MKAQRGPKREHQQKGLEAWGSASVGKAQAQTPEPVICNPSYSQPVSRYPVLLALQDKKYAEAKAEYDEGLKRNPKDTRLGTGSPPGCCKMSGNTPRNATDTRPAMYVIIAGQALRIMLR